MSTFFPCIFVSSPQHGDLPPLTLWPVKEVLIPRNKRTSLKNTLDASGVFLQDLGFAWGDQSFEVSIQRPSKPEIDTFKAWRVLYPYLLISCEDGHFEALLELDLLNGNCKLRVQLIKSLSE